MAKRERICEHEHEAKNMLMFRCAYGNVWIDGRFFASVPKDQPAVSVLGRFSLQPAREVE